MRYDLEGDLERKESSPPPAPAPEQVGDRERLASAVGNSGMARAASSGKAPASMVSGAPMSVARAASELEDAPEEITMGHDEAAPADTAPAEAELEEEH